ncbi:helicase associated domain-containing protein [Colletotrichum graminicola]|uniref:RNA helicase n=1 Tax=Colletotrichum graminicola (strain M1.001 / M2 / FGSC 10212) TaxID=645133 RepID=E3QT59_COLGM|nr:helicase associated domain-containing protein [Colletotrichum graminicola M1.001]EFQ34047.1 helicase associated domain-containing protein [Colletotrichum graminicola M1.001]WDK20816.1 helicase associated domain-containing protein [Colletotrichum graminicola]
MAGAKKKKKPAANPARGFATTSVASSKPRTEPAEGPDNGAAVRSATAAPNAVSNQDAPPSDPQSASAGAGDKATKAELTPEEFEKQLDESELQLLVEKYAQKTKRDAQRQRTRLETDRRLLRSQADTVNSRKWLPQELMDQVLDLIQAESRFASSSVSTETAVSGKLLPEEDMIIKLWTLQQTLTGVGFPEERVQAVMRHILDIAPNIPSTAKDSLWGLEEALDWMARECPSDELPDYEGRGKQGTRQLDTPAESPLPSGATTPRASEPGGRQKGGQRSKNGGSATSKKKTVVTCDSDIEPDDLVPVYLVTKAKLFELERSQQGKKKQRNGDSGSDEGAETLDKLRAKIDRIDKDVLFDKFAAEQQWRTQKVALEKEIAAARKQKSLEQAQKEAERDTEGPVASSDGDINDEAERIAAEVLAQGEDDEDGGLSDLFANLPVSEVDAAGKSSIVLNGADGVKITIRDFGKWTGVSPMRALEEACRARDPAVKVTYRLISEVPFANRHAVSISWSRSQETPPPSQDDSVEVGTYPSIFNFTMKSVATPDSKQSEAYVATWALFHIFGTSAKEEKVGMRLPVAWRDLWDELAEARKSQLDAKDREAIRELRALVRQRQDQELEDGVILQSAFKGRGTARNQNEKGDESSQEAAKRLSGGPEYYQNIWAQKTNSPRYQAMLQGRMQLPMWNFKQQVTDAVDREQVVIVCGETGCGKSTQVPAFLLEHQLTQGKPCKIYCTEPRRISAISLARRVSEELGEGRGDLGTSRSLVGYSIRLEANTSRETRLVFATTGIVMRMLEGSNDLREVTHLVLDEVHERSIDSDFLLIILKKLMLRRKDLKVVLMSATVDAERFSKYLGGAPVLTVPGRTFPVQVRYLEDAIETTGYTVGQASQEKMVDLDDDVVETEVERPKSIAGADLSAYSAKTRNSLAQMDEYRIDFDLIVQLIAKIASDSEYVAYSKAILVFLPGIAEIRTLNDLLSGDPSFARDWLIYPLHSTIATEDQEAAFLVPPPGMRKIVLATNIAETGITIPDVTCVIDTGKHREMRFDERRQLSRLIDTFISRANAKQRRGRAGRVQDGLCFHLFTKHRHDTIMSDQQTPEMLRLSLQDLAIRVKICKIGGIEETLSEALDPPSAKNIRRAVDALIDVRALTPAEDLTPLGNQLARLPLDVFLGKLILMGAIFKCLDMAITVAAILSSKSPFTAPFGQRAQADLVRKGFRRGDSDLLTVYNAYLSWKRVCQSTSASGGKDFQFCRKNFLSQQTLANIEDLKGQLLVSVADSGFLLLTDDERRALNRLRYGANSRGRRHQNFFDIPQRVSINSENDAITTAVVAWSFYPKLLVRDNLGSRGLRNVGNNQSISLHPSSVNKGHNELKWLSYYHIMQSKSVYHAHETSAADPFAIALLCGDVRADMFSGVLVLDGNRCRFALPDWKTMLVIKVLRTRLRELLTRSFKQPGKLPTAQHERWLAIWQKIFSQEANKDNGNTTVSKA